MKRYMILYGLSVVVRIMQQNPLLRTDETNQIQLRVCMVFMCPRTVQLCVKIYSFSFSTVQGVKAAKNPNNPTFTSTTLPLHTDHPYYFNVPGVSKKQTTFLQGGGGWGAESH